MHKAVPQVAHQSEHHTSPPTSQPGGLFALALAGRDYEFLNAGYPVLAQGAADSNLVVLMIRALVKLGLGGPARELLQHARHLNLALDFEAMRALLVPLPIGRVPWKELENTYRANTIALGEVQPELGTVLTEIESTARSAQLFRTNDGSPLLSHSTSGAVRSWNPGFFDPAIMARAPIPESKPGSPTIITGLGSDALITRIIEATATRELEAGVLLLVAEDDPARIFAWLHTMNIAPLIREGRMRLFLGTNAPQQLATFLAANPDVDIPSSAAVPHWANALSKCVGDVARQESARRENEYLAVVTSLQSRAARRTPHDHAERLTQGATILGFTSRLTTMLQYSMRDIGAALAEHGYNFVMIREADAQRTHSTLTVARAIEEHDPALAIMINHFRVERAQAMTGVPVLSWIQDPTPMALSRSTGESIGELDFVCGYYIERCTQELGYPAARFTSLCLPVSTHIFNDQPLEDDDAQQYACDVMYVGHRHADANAHVQSWRAQTPAELYPLLESIRAHVEALIAVGAPAGDSLRTVATLAHDAMLDLAPTHIERLAEHFLNRLYDIHYRAQTLSWIAGWASRTGRSFKLYGRGWDSFPALAPFAVGPIDHGEPLRKAYRGAKIVLQTLPAGFMHQRTFEGLASGSLVLARHAPTSSAAEHFAGLDRVIFHRETDLLDMCERYLADEALRSAVTTELRDVVMREFTYSAMMPRLVEHIRRGLRSGAHS